MAKTEKSKTMALMTSNTQSVPSVSPEGSIHIYDGSAQLHALVRILDTFKAICLKILDLLYKTSDVFFSTDMYHPSSIKSQERIRRGTGGKLPIEGVKTGEGFLFHRKCGWHFC